MKGMVELLADDFVQECVLGLMALVLGHAVSSRDRGGVRPQ